MSRKEWLRKHQDLILVPAVLIVYVGASFILPMKCPILWLTGISCPGCGITRALISLCRLDFATAWQYNPMIYYLIPLMPTLLVLYLRNAKKAVETLLAISAALMILVWLCRLLLHCPVLTFAPSQGFIPRLFQ